MPTCSATYISNVLTPDPGCAEDCMHTDYGIVSVTSSIEPDGSCGFRYEVRREPDGKSFAGTVTVNCPSTKTITFYCDDAGKCPIFELVLKCIQDLPPHN